MGPKFPRPCTVTYHSQLVSPIMIMVTNKETIPILPLLFIFQLYLVIPMEKTCIVITATHMKHYIANNGHAPSLHVICI